MKEIKGKSEEEEDNDHNEEEKIVWEMRLIKLLDKFMNNRNW